MPRLRQIVKDRGVNIVATSNSWGGGGCSQALYDAIDTQRQRGILFIAAAGNAAADNDSGAFYPANYKLRSRALRDPQQDRAALRRMRREIRPDFRTTRVLTVPTSRGIH
jgi:hypothetical protein